MIDSSGCRTPGGGPDPCPPWCTDLPGHPYHGVDPGGRRVRTHSRDLSAHVSLVLDEAEGEPLAARSVRLFVLSDVEPLSGNEACRLAGELLNGADQIEALSRRAAAARDGKAW